MTSCVTGNYPTSKEINGFFLSYPLSSDEHQRKAYVRNMLFRLANPETVEEDRRLEDFVEQLADKYLQEYDKAILEAVDSVEIQAGFANFICGFYSKIKGSNSFVERYSLPAFKKHITRCIGIAFSENDIDVLLGPNWK
jgi:hypothetical protein